MKKNEYSIREFAEAFDPSFTRQGILKHINSGVLKANRDGRNFTLDITQKDNAEFIKNSERKFTEKPVELPAPKHPKKAKPVKVKKEKQPKKTKAVAVKKPKKQEKKKSVKEGKLPAHIIKKLDEGRLKASELIDLPKVTVEKIKIYEATKQIVQKRQQERRELISAKLLRIIFGKLFEIHTNEFLTIKSKSVANIAGVFGSTDEEKKLQAEKILDEDLWEVLQHIKIEFNKFLVKTGNEPIK
ncbi:MAG: hypothetical protein PVG39_02655 [Desulfobacteraceae bacterium]|jgi:hypothetical protein